MCAQADLADELGHFFAAFCADVSHFDGSLIAQRYMAPYTALNAEGALQVLTTQADIAQYFQGFLDQYRAQGCRTCHAQDLQAVSLGQLSALVSVTWQLLSEDQRVVSQWRESYNLTRTPQGLRIYASTDHVDER